MLCTVAFGKAASPQCKDAVLLQTRSSAHKAEARGVADFFEEIKSEGISALEALKEKVEQVDAKVWSHIKKDEGKFRDRLAREMEKQKSLYNKKKSQKIVEATSALEALKEEAGLEDGAIADFKGKLEGLMDESSDEMSKYDWRNDNGDKIEEMNKALDRPYPQVREPVDGLKEKAIAAAQAKAADEEGKKKAKERVEKIASDVELAFNKSVRTALGMKLKAKRTLSGLSEGLEKRLLQKAADANQEEPVKNAIAEFKTKLAVRKESSSDSSSD